MGTNTLGLYNSAILWTGLSIALTTTVLFITTKRRRSGGPDTLRGPPSDSFLIGHLKTVRDANDLEKLDAWTKEYGDAFVTRSFMGMKELYLLDVKALAYIYAHPMDFPKPWPWIRIIESLTGPGLLTAEGDAHKKQKKVLNPAFSVPQMQQIATPILRKAEELRDRWISLLVDSEVPKSADDKSKSDTLDVLDWAGRTALDIVCETVLGYKSDSLYNDDNELVCALHDLLTIVSGFDVLGLARSFFPILKYVPDTGNKMVTRSSNIMRKISHTLVAEKKAELAGLDEASKSELLGKDVLSVLVKSNLRENPEDRLDEENELAQVMTMILAGHETVAGGLAWALYELARHPMMQAKLWDELHAFSSESPSMDEILSLHYLDCFVKEVLRLHTLVVTTTKSAGHDLILPLGKPIVDKMGNQYYEVFLKAGDTITISNHLVNINKELWGADAREFRPERFDNLPEAVSAIPSVFGNVITFAAGAKACIGWRMAVLEMKYVLFVLARAFEFDIEPSLQVKVKALMAARPIVAGEEDRGPRLPLKVSLRK